MKLIPTINYHLTNKCNMRCKYCFAGFSEIKNTENLSFRQNLLLIQQLKDAGFEKINFAGGEPMLHPQIFELLQFAKEIGFVTSIITNGSRLNDFSINQLSKHTDIIGISIDSLFDKTNEKIGRVWANKNVISKENYINICTKIKEYNIFLKINTVVSMLNIGEDFSDFIKLVQPERWKIFQVMKVEDQNGLKILPLLVNDEDYQSFVQKHRISLGTNTECIVPESNHIMRGSYIMIDPAGKFYDSTAGNHQYSEPILNCGVLPALNQISFDFCKFFTRDGFFYQNIQTLNK